MQSNNANSDQRRLAAIMFTDIVGYSALTQRDEALALSLLADHNRILRAAIALHKGNEIKTVGDAFLVEFGSALEAVRCAMSIQNDLHQRNAADASESLHARIGIHLGDIVFRDGDVFGDGVNIASRVQAEAAPDGICVSEDIARQVQNKIGVPLQELGKRTLKNIQTPVAIYAVQMPWAGGPETADEASRAKKDRRRMQAAIIGLLVVVGVGAALAWRYSGTPATADGGAATSARTKSIAVLPFVNLGGIKDDEYFGDGITEDLLTQLAQVSDLKVISRTSAMQYKGTKKSMREIARELGVANILEGSVRRSENRFRINAQLIDAERDEHLWAKTYDRDIRDVLAVQTEVTTEIATALKATLQLSERKQLQKHAQGNAEAYVLYIKGKHLLYRPKNTAETTNLARANFEKSIELDPKSPLGHVGLAWLELALSAARRTDPIESAKRAEAHTQRALALDENSSDALMLLARIRGVDQWNWREAEKLAKRAVDVNPGNADAWYVYGVVIEPAGRLAEAEAATRRSVALDPLNTPSGWRLAQLLYEQNRCDDAIALARSTLQIDPGALSLYFVIARCFEKQKKFTDAIAALRLSRADFLTETDINSTETAFARDGEAGYWRSRYEIQKQWARGKTADTKYFLAISASLAGQNDQAFAYLDEAVAQRDRNITRVKVEPAFDGIRGDPRYLKILARLNLE